MSCSGEGGADGGEASAALAVAVAGQISKICSWMYLCSVYLSRPEACLLHTDGKWS